MKKILLLIFIILLLASSAYSRVRYSGIAQRGGKAVSTSPSNTYKLMETFPNCTVTVYFTGTTTLVDIFSNDSGTIQANPFTANSLAAFYFYVDAGVYDIKFSGTGISSPFTIAAISINGSGGGNVPVCGGVDDTAVFTDIITQIGADQGTIQLPATLCVINNLTIPSNVTIDNTYGAGIEINSGQILTFEGVPNSPDKPFFYNALIGEGAVNFTNATKVVAAWWSDGNFGEKILAAQAALPSRGGTIDATSLVGTQTVSATLALTKSYTRILLPIANITFGTNNLTIAQGTEGISLVGYYTWGHGNNATETPNGTNFICTGSNYCIHVGSTAGLTYTPAIFDITVDARGSINTSGIAFQNVLHGVIQRFLGRGGGQSAANVGIGLLGTNSTNIYNAVNTVEQFRLYNFKTGMRLFGPISSVNGNWIRDGNIAAVSQLVAGTIGMDLDGAESTTVTGVDIEGYNGGIRFTHDLNVLNNVRMENLGKASDSPAGYSLRFEVGAGQNSIQTMPALNAMDTIIELNAPYDNCWESGISRGCPLIVTKSNGTRYFSPTDLFSGFGAMMNPEIEIGDDTAVASTVPFSVFSLAGRKTIADVVVGQIVFVNRQIADGSDKRITSITGGTGTTVNSGYLAFATMSAGVGTERARITETGIFNSYMGANVASAADIVPTGNTFVVTGTTNITSINATGIQAGTEITLIFAGVLTVVDGGNMDLAGNFVTTSNDTLTVKYIGSNLWLEVGRSIN